MLVLTLNIKASSFFKQLIISSLLLSGLFSFSAAADERRIEDFEILSMQQRSVVIDSILEKRVNKLMPKLMRRANIDMWILISREYNEDPILKTMLPSTWMGARRRTILIFTDLGDEGVKAQAMSRYDVGNVFSKAWDKESEPNQMKALVKLISQFDPKRIAVNQSKDFELADGLVATERDLLFSYLPAKYSARVVSSEPLAVSWLETRIDEEIAIYKDLVALTKAIIKQGFSTQTITVRKTTLGDLVWWFRETVSQLGLQTWFQPSIRLQRKHKTMGVSEDPTLIILPGDLLHVDFGINYLRLNTDIQQHAYVLNNGQNSAPTYLQDALKKGNRLQDILTSHFKRNRSGNEILSKSREQALLEGLNPMIYTHPIGYHGHAAGTTIGKWDSQFGVPGEGDRILQDSTAYAIELNVTVPIKEWQKDIMIMLEENALYKNTDLNYLAPRQKELILIDYK